MSATTEQHELGLGAPARSECRERLPAAAARRILEMEPAERPAALEAMPSSEALAAFLEMAPAVQASVLEHLDLEPAARLANRLPFNTLARVLDRMGVERRHKVVRNLRPLKRSRVETVLSRRLY